MTGKERFITALKREPLKGHVPHFELVFFLTMEVLGKVHPSHRFYEQWNQMSAIEKNLQLTDMADIYIDIAKKYHHDAIFVHPNPGDIDSTKRLLEIIREKTGDQYYTMMHGDTTCAIPNGDDMMDFSCKMYEEPEEVDEMQKRNEDQAFEIARELSGTGLLDGFALCSDYSLNANPFFPQDIFAQLIAPHLKKEIDVYRKLGFYTIKHSDGNLMPIFDQIVDCKPDAIHSIDPQGSMNLGELRAKYGDRVCLIGNVNCGLLQTGTDEEAATDVRRALSEGMADGGRGYIFSTSNCVYTGLALKRYEMMHDIWQAEGILR